jgi:hypothetical protein
MMAGAAGAPVCVQLFEVVLAKGESLRINDNGTPVGTPSSHGFDVSISRTDDFIEGPRYRSRAEKDRSFAQKDRP